MSPNEEAEGKIIDAKEEDEGGEEEEEMVVCTKEETEKSEEETEEEVVVVKTKCGCNLSEHCGDAWTESHCNNVHVSGGTIDLEFPVSAKPELFCLLFSHSHASKFSVCVVLEVCLKSVYVILCVCNTMPVYHVDYFSHSHQLVLSLCPSLPPSLPPSPPSSLSRHGPWMITQLYSVIFRQTQLRRYIYIYIYVLCL